jgi:hypothetical protein
MKKLIKPRRPTFPLEFPDVFREYINKLDKYVEAVEQKKYEPTILMKKENEKLKKIIKLNRMGINVPEGKENRLHIPKPQIKILRPLDFVIKQETFDLLSFDSFFSKKLKIVHVRDLHRMLKMAKMFMSPGNKYDYPSTILMLYALSLEYFTRDGVRALLAHCVSENKSDRILSFLVKNEYIAYNYDYRVKRKLFFITTKGKEATTNFFKAYKEYELNINFYEPNFRWAFSKAEGPKREKYTFARQYKHLYGKPFQAQFERTKSVNSYHRERASTESSES